MPVTVTVQFTTKPGKRDALIAMLEDVQAQALAGGCHSIAVYRALDDDTQAFEIEQWNSQAEHRAYVEAAGASGAFAGLEQLLADKPVVTYGELVKQSQR